jgi:hypothetical protein
VGAVALAGAAVDAVTAASGVRRPATLCLLRAATGVPCPFCGTTTAAVRAAGGDVLGALAANPVTVVALVALVLAPLFVHRVPRSAMSPLLTAGVVVAWVWQLARFGLLPV